MHSVDDVNSVRLWVGDLLLHETSEPWQICGDTWDSHDCAFGWSVSPGLVVAGEYAHVTAPNKLLVVQAKEWIGWR